MLTLKFVQPWHKKKDIYESHCFCWEQLPLALTIEACFHFHLLLKIAQLGCSLCHSNTSAFFKQEHVTSPLSSDIVTTIFFEHESWFSTSAGSPLRVHIWSWPAAIIVADAFPTRNTMQIASHNVVILWLSSLPVEPRFCPFWEHGIQTEIFRAKLLKFSHTASQQNIFAVLPEDLLLIFSYSIMILPS